MVQFGELIVILELHHGLSVSAIARRTGMSRGTIRKYATRGIEPPAYGPSPATAEPAGLLRALLRDARFLCGADRSWLHREIRELGYSGGSTAVKAASE